MNTKLLIVASMVVLYHGGKMIFSGWSHCSQEMDDVAQLALACKTCE